MHTVLIPLGNSSSESVNYHQGSAAASGDIQALLYSSKINWKPETLNSKTAANGWVGVMKI